MGRTEKSAATIGIIGGADGPTAVCTAGRKIPLKHRIRRMWYDLKRKRIAKRIKPEPHSMEEVTQEDIDSGSRRYKELISTLAR